MGYNKDYEIKNKKYREIVKLKSNRQYEKAIVKLLEFNSEYPGDIYGQVDYASCLLRTNKRDEGIEILENLIKRKNKIRKLDFLIYSELLDTYGKKNELDKCRDLIIDAISILDNYEVQVLKIKYLYHAGLSFKAEEELKKIKPKTIRDEAMFFNLKLHYCNNKYLRANRKEIEKLLKKYVNKSVLSEYSAKKLFFKLYSACNNDEEAYKYINTEIGYRPDKIIESYKLCERLGKKEEAQEYLDKLNNCDEKLFSITTLIELLYINGEKNKAFDKCLQVYKTNIDALILLLSYSVKLDRINEGIDAAKNYIKDRNITNYKEIAIIERLIDLLIYEKKYEEAYSYLNIYKDYLDEISNEQYNIYLSKKLNIKYECNKKVNSYFINQLKNYNYQNVIKHISKHKYQNKEKAVHTLFNDDIEVEKLLEMLKPYLTKENLYEVGVINRYEINCEDIDINEKRIIVGLIEDNFVFCFPSKFYIDELDEEIDEYEENPKIKRLSQIEKFNKKYNLG